MKKLLLILVLALSACSMFSHKYALIMRDQTGEIIGVYAPDHKVGEFDTKEACQAKADKLALFFVLSGATGECVDLKVGQEVHEKIMRENAQNG